MKRQVKPEALALTVISGWEFLSLASGRIPTITSLVGRLPRWGRRCVSTVAAVWLVRHWD